MFLSWVITGDLRAGMQIGLVDVFIKMVLYYLHERVWFISSLTNSNKRHLFKTITWRIIGTVSTIILALWIWGDSTESFQIGGAETLTKTILYYFHEKFWYRLSFGLKKKRRNLKEQTNI
jgi:uncharacterized membrane protein